VVAGERTFPLHDRVLAIAADRILADVEPPPSAS
jgi:hypothetical protein